MHIRSALRRALALVVSIGFVSTPLLAEERLELRWRDLASVVTGKRVWLPLNGGVRISGTVREVESAGLRIEVRKTSDRRAYPKGLVSVPRSAVSIILLSKPVGHKGIIIGGAVGGGIGATAGGTLAAIRRNEGGTAGNGIIAAAAVGPIAVGLLVGWLFDAAAHHRGKRIIIRAD